RPTDSPRRSRRPTDQGDRSMSQKAQDRKHKVESRRQQAEGQVPAEGRKTGARAFIVCCLLPTVYWLLAPAAAEDRPLAPASRDALDVVLFTAERPVLLRLH